MKQSLIVILTGQRLGARARAVAAGIVVPVLLAAGAHQDAEPQPEPGAKAQDAAPVPGPAESPLSLQLNFDYTTAYFFRGIIQEDSGLILQPAAKVAANFLDEDEFKIDGFLATWSSFQGQKTGAQTHGDFTEYWYECDLIGGVSLTQGKFSATIAYYFYTSPSDAFQTVQELDLTLAYDDGDLLDAWALHPYALVATETGADASDGADSDTGTYLELGIGPGFSFDVSETAVSITFPVSVGLSLSDYYQDANGDDDTFGFFQVGAKGSVPLPFGERYGAWSLSAGVFGLFLGDHTAEYNGGDDTQLIGTVGIQANF